MKRLARHPYFIFERSGKLLLCREKDGHPQFWAGDFDWVSIDNSLSDSLIEDIANALGISLNEIRNRLNAVKSQNLISVQRPDLRANEDE